jgi:parallel beta-helix repeat protein
MPGTYSETVYIDKDDIHLVGVIQEGERATMDGLGKLNDAILYSGNNVVVENFRITQYKGNGIMGQAGNNFEIRNNVIIDTGIYGIFPQLGTNGLVEHNVVSGIADAAIYIGMSDNIHVAHNEVFDSVAGIEIENSRHAVVENNIAYNNTGGILAFVTPGLPIKTTEDVIIRNNFVLDNNTPNFGAPGSIVSGIPAGTGILVMAADDVVIEGNIISNNKTAGIIINDHSYASNITMDMESDPNSDRTIILDNVMLNNGYDTIPEVTAVALTELHTGLIDIVHVGPSNGSCIINRHRYRAVGIGNYGECDFTNTDNTESYLLAGGAEPRVIHPSERGEIAYLGVCTGCHSYTGRLIGPSVQVIQTMYAGNPEGLVDYINAPVKKRDNFPPMPAQNYLDAETQMAVANYMLALEK